ncbi:MAG: hypothetical protein FWG32_05620 [Oscillospiraceae bacterium]|nr:hypothetical protein [Oscillospiraceae bacterium]
MKNDDTEDIYGNPEFWVLSTMPPDIPDSELVKIFETNDSSVSGSSRKKTWFHDIMDFEGIPYRVSITGRSVSKKYVETQSVFVEKKHYIKARRLIAEYNDPANFVEEPADEEMTYSAETGLPQVQCESCGRKIDFDYHTCPYCKGKIKAGKKRAETGRAIAPAAAEPGPRKLPVGTAAPEEAKPPAAPPPYAAPPDPPPDKPENRTPREILREADGKKLKEFTAGLSEFKLSELVGKLDSFALQEIAGKLSGRELQEALGKLKDRTLQNIFGDPEVVRDFKSSLGNLDEYMLRKLPGEFDIFTLRELFSKPDVSALRRIMGGPDASELKVILGGLNDRELQKLLDEFGVYC